MARVRSALWAESMYEYRVMRPQHMGSDHKPI
jgi:hypothetical protein